MTAPTPVLWRLAIGLVAIVALASCGGDDDSSSDNGGSSNGDSAAPAESFTLVTKEFFFEPDSVTVAAGATEIVVDNTGGMVEHDFNLEDFDVEIYAGPGDTESEVVNLTAGTYDFFCSIPGHREAGMEGTLTVN